MNQDYIGVSPKNLQKIVRYVMDRLPEVIIYLDKLQVSGLNDQVISQDRISLARNFLVTSRSDRVLGFHDHPREMWIERNFIHLAKEMQSQGWLVIESVE